jgi:hypothetical protein
MSESLATLSLSSTMLRIRKELRTDLTLELKIRIFVFMLICVDAKAFFNITKVPLALPILAVTFLSVPPSPACRPHFPRRQTIPPLIGSVKFCVELIFKQNMSLLLRNTFNINGENKQTNKTTPPKKKQPQN